MDLLWGDTIYLEYSLRHSPAKHANTLAKAANDV